MFGLTIFFATFEIGFVLLGAGVFRDAPIELGIVDMIAVVLLVTGSFLNSFSEMQRKWWKAKASSQGSCYTKGLFAHAMHINFFGDVVLFTGWSLFTYSVWALGLPLMMLLMRAEGRRVGRKCRIGCGGRWSP